MVEFKWALRRMFHSTVPTKEEAFGLAGALVTEKYERRILGDGIVQRTRTRTRNTNGRY